MAANDNRQRYSNLYNGSAAYAIPEIQWQEQENNQPEIAERPKPQKAVQTKYGISALSVVGFVVVAVLAVMMLMSYIAYTDAAADTMEYKNRIEEITETQRKLTIAYEQAFNINEVEAYARNVLGMDKPARDQIGTAVTGSYDRAIVYDQSEINDTSGIKGLFTFLSNLSEYFG